MQILEVHALSFGPLRRARLELAPGLTVICGGNEAGKSSWHGALQLGICGMRRARGRPRTEQDLIRRHRPWEGDEWKVRLRIALGDGRELDVTQDLDDPTESSIVDVVTGRPFDGDLYHQGSLDASRLLGLNREIFASVISVRQAQILEIRQQADGLQEQLQRAAQASAADETAVAAIDRLVEFRSTRVGLRRRGATKPLQAADDELRAAAQALEHARRAHVEYTELLSSHGRAREAQARATAEHERARRAYVLRQRADLALRIGEIRPLAARFVNGPPSSTEPLIDEERQLRELIVAWEQRPSAEPPPSGRSAADLEREIDSLPTPPEGDVEVAPEVEEARDRHLRAVDDLDRHGRDAPDAPPDETLFGGATAAELRGLAETLDRRLPQLDAGLDRDLADVEAKLASTRRSTLICGLAAVVALIGAVALVLIGRGAWSIVPFVASLAAAALAWNRRRSTETDIRRQATLAERRDSQRRLRSDAERARDEAARRLTSLGLPTEREGVLRAAAALDDAESRRERRTLWQRIEIELQTARAAAETELRRVLGEHGVPEAASAPSNQLAGLVAGYIARCRSNRDQLSRASRRRDLTATLALRRQQEESFERASATQAELAARLIDAGRSLRGTAVLDESAALHSIRECVLELDRRRNELEIAHREHHRLLGLLEGATLERLEADLTDLDGELAKLDAVSTEVPDASASELAQAVERSREALDRSRAEARQLEGMLEERTRSVPDVVAAQERHRAARGAVDRIEALDSILEKTITILEEAKDETQREIAPRLRAAILPQLPLATAGRYVDLRIDPDTLEVQALERDGDWRSAMGLSHGTAEQIYLLLRLALARTLVVAGETSPLLLDDVTVQSDSERTRAILDLLQRESADRQVILFSQQDEVLAWAKERLIAPNDRLIELSGPARALAVGK